MQRRIFSIGVMVMSLSLSVSAEAFQVSAVKTSIVDSEMNMDVQFHVDKNYQQWSFGFYMPRTFNQSATINPDIQMRLCEKDAASSNCTPMHYVKKTENSAVFGDGSVNVFAPAVGANFNLVAGETYTFSIEKSNQPAPANLSSVAQHFFLYDEVTKIFANSAVSLKAYGADINTLQNMGGYNYAAVTAATHAHILSNWSTSMPLASGNLADQYHLVPSPNVMTALSGQGMSLLGRRSLSLYNAFSGDDTLKNDLVSDLKLRVIAVNQPASADIAIEKTNAISNPEGYSIVVEQGKIILKASTDTGAFYGIQTLRQLWNQTSVLPAISVSDAPRFKYRGVLLDVSRHFFSVPEVKQLMNAMAIQKLNTLHIHFADDEGWRLAIPALSAEVIQKAALRGFVAGSSNVPGVFSQANVDTTNYINNQPSFDPSKLLVSTYPAENTAYTNIYSAQDIKNIVAYANARHITVLPEVDFPGHARALIQADPNVFVNPGDTSQYISVQGYYDDVLPVCLYGAASPQAQAFTQIMNAIVTDIADLFSHQTTLYAENEVSLGADEVSADAWTSDSSCSGAWNGLSALDKTHYFFKQLAPANPTIKLSGWQQLVQENDEKIGVHALAPHQTAHIWVWNTVAWGAIPQAVALAKADYPTVLAFSNDLYFDLAYNPNAWEPGYYWAGQYLDTHAALNGALDANTVMSQLSTTEQANILGLEGALWSENLMNAKHLAYMALPKMAGLAEAAWSSHAVVAGKLNWQSLATRLGTDQEGFLAYLYRMTGLPYRGYPHGIAQEIPSQ